MFAHPVGLGETRTSNNIIMDEISEKNFQVGGEIPEANHDVMFFGDGWKIVKNMVA